MQRGSFEKLKEEPQDSLFGPLMATVAFSKGSAHLFLIRQRLMAILAIHMIGLLKVWDIVHIFGGHVAFYAFFCRAPRHPCVFLVYVIVMALPAKDPVIKGMLEMVELDRPLTVPRISLVFDRDEVKLVTVRNVHGHIRFRFGFFRRIFRTRDDSG